MGFLPLRALKRQLTFLTMLQAAHTNLEKPALRE